MVKRPKMAGSALKWPPKLSKRPKRVQSGLKWGKIVGNGEIRAKVVYWHKMAWGRFLREFSKFQAFFKRNYQKNAYIWVNALKIWKIRLKMRLKFEKIRFNQISSVFPANFPISSVFRQFFNFYPYCKRMFRILSVFQANSPWNWSEFSKI